MLTVKKALKEISKTYKCYKKGKITTPVANTRARILQVYRDLLWLDLRDEKSINSVTK